jgi:hypothetical protein
VFEGLKLYPAHRAEIVRVVTDLIIPKTTGFELYEAFRAAVSDDEEAPEQAGLVTVARGRIELPTRGFSVRRAKGNQTERKPEQGDTLPAEPTMGGP